MLLITLITLLFFLALVASLIFISSGIMAARTDEREEQLYRALMGAEV